VEAHAQELGFEPTMDADFVADLKEIINTRRPRPFRTGIILDSSVLAAAERGGNRIAQILRHIERAN
jgi:hypothetical protein